MLADANDVIYRPESVAFTWYILVWTLSKPFLTYVLHTFPFWYGLYK